MYSKYLNRHNLNVNRDSDRTMQQIESELDSLESLAKSQQSVRLLTTDKLETEPVNILSGEGMNFVLSVTILMFAAVFILKTGLQRIKKDNFKNLEYNSTVSCHKCYFYNRNYYLKCAVHPNKVLTKKAEECRDYQPRK